MPLLFSYGTLQHEHVQRELFGRALRAEPDLLAGFTMHTVMVSDLAAPDGRAPHAIVRLSGNEHDRVNGTALDVRDADLDAADRYEPHGYARIAARLVSGRDAWVYADLASAAGVRDFARELACAHPELDRNALTRNPVQMSPLFARLEQRYPGLANEEYANALALGFRLRDDGAGELAQHAYQVADDFRRGRFGSERAEWSAQWRELCAELRGRCPGFTDREYDEGLEHGFRASR